MIVNTLEKALRTKYSLPEFALETEITLAAGGKERRIDVLVMGLWPSTGQKLFGFELKVDRRDFLREIADHTKAEGWMQVVDAFYFVTTPGVVQAGEIPAGCGHLELRGEKLMTKAYPIHKGTQQPIPRSVTARMIARMAEANERRMRDAQQEMRREALADAGKSLEREPLVARTKMLEEELRKERERTTDLCKLAGIDPHDWARHQTLLRACTIMGRVRSVDTLRHNIRMLQTTAGHLATDLTAALAALEGFSE